MPNKSGLGLVNCPFYCILTKKIIQELSLRFVTTCTKHLSSVMPNVLKTPSKEEVVVKIRELINQKGYIYALCMILFEDFHIDIENVHKIDYKSRISKNESLLLIGFLIQNELDFSFPDSPLDLISMKEKTYKLLEELHLSFMESFAEKMVNTAREIKKDPNYKNSERDFFGTGDMLVEPIFYSGDGVYDFQYLDYLDKKYKYDRKWLEEKKSFDIKKTKKIVLRTKEILQEKSKKVRLIRPKDRMPEMVAKMKKNQPDEDWEKHAKEMIPMMEIYQYVNLFFENQIEGDNFDLDKIREEGWKSFYQGLIDLFVVNVSDFSSDLNIESFFQNFSTIPKKGLNDGFKMIGDFNLSLAKPIIQIDKQRYFVPISFSLFEAVYESPFYWIIEDREYFSKHGSANRGKASEEMTRDFLVNVFGKNDTFESVKIIRKKGEADTDIDILCLLGNKALCVQVKSQKLTELSRKGSDEALNGDFQKAVQDAYEQGRKSRTSILERGVTFLDREGKEISISEEIDEVYLMIVTTENYPSLTHQAHILLNKEQDDPFPLTITIFDLEILAHYLKNPYDFLYYVRQRISLIEYFRADEEIIYLGFHLMHKLYKDEEYNYCALDGSFGQFIDRNFYPIKADIEVSDAGDKIKKRWKNEKFQMVIDQLQSAKIAGFTDAIFYLYDLSSKDVDDLIQAIENTKEKTRREKRLHDFSMIFDKGKSGVSFISIPQENSEELESRLMSLAIGRKYKTKADTWLAFGYRTGSKNFLDFIAFTKQPWQEDKKLEEVASILRKGIEVLPNLKKIGRNDLCYCESGKKYKKCHGSGCQPLNL